MRLSEVQGNNILRRFYDTLKQFFPQSFRLFLRHNIIQPVTLYRIKKKHIKTHKILVKQVNSYYDKAEYLTVNMPHGVNVTGFIAGEMGIGECGRGLVRSLNASEIPYTIRNIELTSSSNDDSEFSSKFNDSFIYNTNIIVMNPDFLWNLIKSWDKTDLSNHYNIGYWNWELSELPDDWIAQLSLIHEVWCSSRFTEQTLRKVTDIPIHRVPISISLECKAGLTRQTFGLPEDKFLFLSMYDIFSTQMRKNPRGAIDAFIKAFQNDTSVCMVVKVNHASDDNVDLINLREDYKNYKNIIFYNKSLRRNELNSFMSLTDCYISLHRAEGFGLPLAECMYLGLPVIGTNWSGNTEFMNIHNSCPVDYKFAELEDDYYIYRKGNIWAEPDIEHAASYMKKLVNDKQYYKTIAAAGQKTIHDEYSPEVIGKLVKQRLTALNLI